tara:strand:+ start:663 stop:782 length:120 start_codon:yes stop_codon:yes gene_type:complete
MFEDIDKNYLYLILLGIFITVLFIVLKDNGTVEPFTKDY